MTHYFISYSRVDGETYANDLADALEAASPKVSPWLDRRRLRPSDENWDAQIDKAIST